MKEATRRKPQIRGIPGIEASSRLAIEPVKEIPASVEMIIYQARVAGKQLGIVGLLLGKLLREYMNMGENFSIPIRLALLVIAGALTYLASIRLIRPAMFTKILELARMALPILRPGKNGADAE